MRLYNGVRLLGSGPSIRNIQKIDAGCIPMVQSMARTGLMVDLDHFAKMEVQLTHDMDQVIEDIHTQTGYYVNPDSGDQVADLLFTKMGLHQARPKLTRGGDRESVADEVLTAIQHDSPVVGLVLNYKEYSKLAGTYVKPIQKFARKTMLPKCNHYTFRVWPNFNTTRVPSGRLSCKEPNLLAIPTRTERGLEIRKGFVADDGYVIVSVDESQIEMRLAAHYSGDDNLVRIYLNEEDIYSDFAIKAFALADKRFYDESLGWQYPGVHKMDHRYPAKTCILASVYDVSPAGLLEQMPVICSNCNLEATKHTCGRFISLWTEEKCGQLINQFYTIYPGVMRDRKRHHARARQYGLVWDLWGRILHVAAARSVHQWVVNGALRECANFPYQSGAQGTIKLTMAQVWDDIKPLVDEGLVRPLLQVHDELLFECREDLADDLIELVKDRFEHCVTLKVPIKASGCKAPSWGLLEK